MKSISKQYVGRNSNKLLVPGVAESLETMKMEIAQELGITLGPNTSSRDNV